MNRTLFKNAAKRLPVARSSHRIAIAVLRRVEFIADFMRFRQLARKNVGRFTLKWRERLPCLEDKTATTDFDRHYVYHPAWAARILAQIRPAFHVDISSTLYFVSLVSAFIPVRFFDYRPAPVELSGLTCERADLLNLPFPTRSVSSLSCMHVVEHVGLGRYGDPLDPEGDIKAMRELERVLAPGGTLLFVVPVGAPVLRFNGHRIYSYDEIATRFSSLYLEEFTLIPEAFADGSLIKGATKERVAAERYGCGCFWFKRNE